MNVYYIFIFNRHSFDICVSYNVRAQIGLWTDHRLDEVPETNRSIKDYLYYLCSNDMHKIDL